MNQSCNQSSHTVRYVLGMLLTRWTFLAGSVTFLLALCWEGRSLEHHQGFRHQPGCTASLPHFHAMKQSNWSSCSEYMGIPSHQIPLPVLCLGKMRSIWNFPPDQRKEQCFLYALCWTVDQWANVQKCSKARKKNETDGKQKTDKDLILVIVKLQNSCWLQ